MQQLPPPEQHRRQEEKKPLQSASSAPSGKALLPACLQPRSTALVPCARSSTALYSGILSPRPVSPGSSHASPPLPPPG